MPPMPTIQSTGAHRVEIIGYNETASDVTQCGIETEASSYLADPDRSLGMLHRLCIHW